MASIPDPSSLSQRLPPPDKIEGALSFSRHDSTPRISSLSPCKVISVDEWKAHRPVSLVYSLPLLSAPGSRLVERNHPLFLAGD